MLLFFYNQEQSCPPEQPIGLLPPGNNADFAPYFNATKKML
jgi:hypothetical protein